MKHSHYNSRTHIGIQPVRVLKFNITHQLEHTHPQFMEEFNKLLADHGLQPAIKYDYTELPIVNLNSPNDSLLPHVNSQKEVTIQETFLSYVWTMCYSLLVIFGEDVEKPQQNHLLKTDHKIDTQALDGARKLFVYGMSLIKSYSSWDRAALPNPEEYCQTETYYVEKTNGLFVTAMGFVLCHEYAHIKLGHLDYRQAYISDCDSIIDEIRADRDALTSMLKGISDHQSKVTTEVGILFGLCSLVLLKAEIQNSRHPDSDDRIETFLCSLNLDETSPIWGFASLCFKLWDNHYKCQLIWPAQAEHFKELFYVIFNQLKAHKD